MCSGSPCVSQPLLIVFTQKLDKQPGVHGDCSIPGNIRTHHQGGEPDVPNVRSPAGRGV